MTRRARSGGATNKALGVVGIGAALLAAAGCTKTVDGAPTAGEKLVLSTEGQTVQAPEQSYIYDNGVVVTLTGADSNPDMNGLISDEVGWTMHFTVENGSDVGLDLSNTASDTEVTCPEGGEYVFPGTSSHPINGPESLAAGDSAEYVVDVALKPKSWDVQCMVEFPFETDEGPATSLARFNMTFTQSGS